MEAVYNAFIDPRALETWQAPGNMAAKIHNFDLEVGGGYQMSLFYPATERGIEGKTTTREDRYRARFIELYLTRKLLKLFDLKLPILY